MSSLAQKLHEFLAEEKEKRREECNDSDSENIPQLKRTVSWRTLLSILRWTGERIKSSVSTSRFPLILTVNVMSDFEF